MKKSLGFYSTTKIYVSYFFPKNAKLMKSSLITRFYLRKSEYLFKFFELVAGLWLLAPGLQNTSL